MNDGKRERAERAREEAAARRHKALVSLSHCLRRSDVMRIHHDALVYELMQEGGIDQFTDVKKHRFSAYVCFWFAGLATVIERFQQLVNSDTIPSSSKVADLLSPEFIDLLKPFRNAVAHCSDHDDERVLQLLGEPQTIPDHAAAVAHALQEYMKEQLGTARAGE